MSKDKQIEEFAEDLRCCHEEYVGDYMDLYTDYYKTAEKLAVIGYRKQSVGGEYIKRDDVLKALTDDGKDGPPYEVIPQVLAAARRKVKQIPAADVVPKSKYDLAVAEREANVKGFAEDLAKAKADVEVLEAELSRYTENLMQMHAQDQRNIARDLLEEIEIKVRQKLPSRPVIIGERALGNSFELGKEKALYAVLNIIDELQKKYTEN